MKAIIFKTEDELKLAIRLLINQYQRHVNKLDPELGLITLLSTDRTYQAYDLHCFFTTRLAPLSHDPTLQEEDERECLSLKIRADITDDKLEEVVNDLLDKLSEIKIAA